MTELPPHLTEEEVRQYANESKTLYDFTQKARVGRTKARRLLNQYGLGDDVARAGDLLG